MRPYTFDEISHSVRNSRVWRSFFRHGWPETSRAKALTVIGEGQGRHTSLRIVSRKELLLNDVVPVLHRMALRATSRLAERLIGQGPDVYITTFEVTGADGRTREVKLTLRIDTPIEVDYYQHGGILPFVLRQLLQA